MRLTVQPELSVKCGSLLLNPHDHQPNIIWSIAFHNIQDNTGPSANLLYLMIVKLETIMSVTVILIALNLLTSKYKPGTRDLDIPRLQLDIIIITLRLTL